MHRAKEVKLWCVWADSAASMELTELYSPKLSVNRAVTGQYCNKASPMTCQEPAPAMVLHDGKIRARYPLRVCHLDLGLAYFRYDLSREWDHFPIHGGLTRYNILVGKGVKGILSSL